MHQAGEDPTTFQGQILKPNEGVAGSISDDGEPRRITDETGPLLAERNAVAPESPVSSLIAAPIMDKGALVGVIEAVNKSDGSLLMTMNCLP